MILRVDPTHDQLRDILSSTEGWAEIASRYGRTGSWVRKVFEKNGVVKPPASVAGKRAASPLTPAQLDYIRSHPQASVRKLAADLGIKYYRIKDVRKQDGWVRPPKPAPKPHPAPVPESPLSKPRTERAGAQRRPTKPVMSDAQAQGMIEEHIRTKGVTKCPPGDGFTEGSIEPITRVAPMTEEKSALQSGRMKAYWAERKARDAPLPK